MLYFLRSPVFTLAIFICFTAVSKADIVFNFVEASSGNTLAVIELSQLPADETSVQSLSFTPAGQLALGLPATYAGQFDFVAAADGPLGANRFGNILSDGSGGLIGSGSIFGDAALTDLQPDQSTLQAGAGTEALVLRFLPAQDSIILRSGNENLAPSIAIAGQFIAVPEPTSFIVLGLGVSALLIRRRKHKTTGK